MRKYLWVGKKSVILTGLRKCLIAQPVESRSVKFAHVCALLACTSGKKKN